MKYTYSLWLFLVCGLCVQSAWAQSNEGATFWLGFMTHRNPGQNTKAVMITAKETTSGVVRMPLQNWQVNFTVAANDVTIITLPISAEAVASESIEKRGVLVESQGPVSVYMHQYATFRSDASLVLPVESIGTEYYAASYQSHQQNEEVYPSEFIVIGTQDNTTVTITVSDNTEGGRLPGETFSVVLNAGESYQVQAAFGTDDLTGSKIVSDKPCSVFSGNVWTGVPADCTWRDNLLEQMYPVATWGKQFVTVPFAYGNYDIFRIMAAEDQTTVQVQGQNTDTYQLQAGEYAEYTSSEATLVSGDKPIAVIQFSIGSNCSNHGVGDPSMVFLNSIEQIRDTVTLYNSPFENIVEHYLNLVARTDDVGNITLDGQTLAALSVVMQPLAANPAFSFASIEVDPGDHTLISVGCGVNVIAYGYGEMESYAYSGGANFRPLDANPIPIGGCLHDTISFDAGLRPPRYAFSWDLGDGFTTTEAAFDHRYNALGNYPVRLIIWDQCLNLVDTFTQTLLITLRQAVSVSPDIEVCTGESVTISASDLAGATYLWSGPGGFVSTHQNLSWPAITPIQSGTYTAVGKISGCATFPAYTEIVVHELPQPNLGPDSLLCPRSEVNTYTLNPGDFEAYRWQDQSQVAEYIAVDEGLYWVDVWDENGCSAADTIRIRERCPTKVYIPNAFSPNSDGINDTFGVFGTDIISLELLIFDRWGGQVFETADVNGQWDGTVRGKPVTAGVYAWMARITGYLATGEVYESLLSGDVTVLR